MAWLLLATLMLMGAVGHDGASVVQRRQPAARRLTEYNVLTNNTELPALQVIDENCRKLVVVFCAVKKADEAGTIHDSYLKVSVLSVLEKAPSLVRLSDFVPIG